MKIKLSPKIISLMMMLLSFFLIGGVATATIAPSGFAPGDGDGSDGGGG